jgi:CheY-like chemotaxis protein
MPSRCVLVVEDEMYLAMMLEDLLIDGGYRVLRAARVQDAIRLAESGECIDAAVLDVNLNGEPVYPVAKRLLERGVPFLFASAYGSQGIAEEYRDAPMLSKPYPERDIIPAIERLVESTTAY